MVEGVDNVDGVVVEDEIVDEDESESSPGSAFPMVAGLSADAVSTGLLNSLMARVPDTDEDRRAR